MRPQSFQHICEAAELWFWTWDVPTDRIEFQTLPAFLKVYAQDRVFTLEGWKSAILPEDTQAVHASILRCLEGEESSYSVTMRMRTTDNGIVWVQDRGWVTKRDANGKPIRLLGVQQDISHIKSMEKQLGAMQTRLDSVVGISKLVPWEWNWVEDKLIVDSHFTREFGYDADTVKEKIAGNWLSIIHPEDISRIKTALRRYIRGEAAHYKEEARFRRANGEYIWCASSGAITDHAEGKPRTIVGGILNIDSLKKTEEALSNALRDNEKLNRRLMRDVAVAEENLRLSKGDVFRQRRLLTTVNGVAVRLLSAKPEAIAEEIQHALQSVGQSVNADKMYMMRDTLKNGEPGLCVLHEWDEDGRVHWGTGTFFPYHLFGDWRDELHKGAPINSHVSKLPKTQRPIFEKIGVQSILILPVFLAEKFWGVIYFGDSRKARISDEAELKTLQSSGILMVSAVERTEASRQLTIALKKAQLSEHVKTMILANVSHEMKTPLNAITGMSGIARHKPEKLDDCLAIIDKAAHRLRSLIDSMLEMSSLACGEFHLEETPFFFASLLGNILTKNSPAAKAKNLSLRIGTDIGSRRKAFIADAGRLEEVINHMVHNAVKYTPSGGIVSVHVREEEMEAGRSQVRICIRDNGIGITQEDMEVLFSPFEQAGKKLSRPSGGTGLGLAVTHGVITAMGGSVTVSSKPGNGTHFSITMPMSSITASEALAGNSDVEPSVAVLKGKRILVVDDNMINREVLAEMLTGLEAVAHTAENGQVALDMVRDAPGGYDLVLMDIQMPVMDGLETTARIRALPCSVPILAVTANSLREDIARYKSAGMSGHVAKPIDLTVLARAMGRCFKKNAGKAARRGSTTEKRAESAA